MTEEGKLDGGCKRRTVKRPKQKLDCWIQTGSDQNLKKPAEKVLPIVLFKVIYSEFEKNVFLELNLSNECNY